MSDPELRRLHAEALERLRKAQRRAWLLLGARAAAGASGALAARWTVLRLHWHPPWWAGVLWLTAVAVWVAWEWRRGGSIRLR